MRPKQVMLIAGEASGDTLGAELVGALREELTRVTVEYTADWQPLHTGLEPQFFGAGGPRMKAAGVELAFDLTEHAIVGIPTPREYLQSRQRFRRLLQVATERQPDVIIGIDYNYFNLRFAEVIRNHVSRRSGWFQDWRPKLVKYISPQLWASREGRAYQIARDYDLLLSLFPFEKPWYAARVPRLHVEFVGHPMLDRISSALSSHRNGESQPIILLLPGSRNSELRRHLPVMLSAFRLIREKVPHAKARMVAPNEALATMAKSLGVDCEIQVGNLPQALAEVDVAIASTGTVTMECALFGLPTVTLYKTPLLGIGLRTGIIKSKWLTMPNIIANEELYPEFLQGAATPQNIARAAVELLQNQSRREQIKARLAEVIASLGGPGASRRAARAITQLLEPRARHRETNRRISNETTIATVHG
jgi:lipid-A-disaccharide synthase